MKYYMKGYVVINGDRYFITTVTTNIRPDKSANLDYELEASIQFNASSTFNKGLHMLEMLLSLITTDAMATANRVKAADALALYICSMLIGCGDAENKFKVVSLMTKCGDSQVASKWIALSDKMIKDMPALRFVQRNRSSSF